MIVKVKPEYMTNAGSDDWSLKGIVVYAKAYDLMIEPCNYGDAERSLPTK